MHFNPLCVVLILSKSAQWFLHSGPFRHPEQKKNSDMEDHFCHRTETVAYKLMKCGVTHAGTPPYIARKFCANRPTVFDVVVLFV